WCDYAPGATTAAPHADTAVPEELPFPTLPATAVDQATTTQQLAVLGDLDQDVREHYVAPDLNGVDWTGFVATTRAEITAGLSADDFATAMEGLVVALGDQHSYYESPADVAAEAEAAAGRVDYVGIGVYGQDIPEAGGGVVIFPFPGGAAEAAG